MQLRIYAFLAVVTVSLAIVIPNGVRGQGEKKPFTLENGKYNVTMVARLSDKDKDQTISFEADLTVKKDGSVTLADPKHPKLPIVGKLEKAMFKAKLDDAAGKVFFEGKLSGDNELTGTITGTHNEGKTTLKGTFKITRISDKTP